MIKLLSLPIENYRLFNEISQSYFFYSGLALPFCGEIRSSENQVLTVQSGFFLFYFRSMLGSHNEDTEEGRKQTILYIRKRIYDVLLHVKNGKVKSPQLDRLIEDTGNLERYIYTPHEVTRCKNGPLHTRRQCSFRSVA